MKTLQTLIK